MGEGGVGVGSPALALTPLESIRTPGTALNVACLVFNKPPEFLLFSLFSLHHFCFENGMHVLVFLEKLV